MAVEPATGIAGIAGRAGDSTEGIAGRAGRAGNSTEGIARLAGGLGRAVKPAETARLAAEIESY